MLLGHEGPHLCATEWCDANEVYWLLWRGLFLYNSVMTVASGTETKKAMSSHPKLLDRECSFGG